MSRLETKKTYPCILGVTLLNFAISITLNDSLFQCVRHDTESANEIDPETEMYFQLSSYEDNKLLQFVHLLKGKSNQTDICVESHPD